MTCSAVQTVTDTRALLLSKQSVRQNHGEVQMLENNRYNKVSRVHKSTISITMLSLLLAERKS